MKSKSAFSLIEVAIVTVIIAILTSGILLGNILIKKSKLATARSLTDNSEVAQIDNLILWYETSLTSSFTNEVSDGVALESWLDNSKQTYHLNNASQNNSVSQPIFCDDIFNDAIPAVRFDGIDDYLKFDGSALVGSEFSIFIVEKKKSQINIDEFGAFIGGNSSTESQYQYSNLYFGYNADNQVTLSDFGDDLICNGDDLAYHDGQKPRIHNVNFSPLNGMSYSLNGSDLHVDATQNHLMPAYIDPALGRVVIGDISGYYNGYLGEIIIFNRHLKEKERHMVEQYLGKKFQINLGQDSQCELVL